MKLLVGDIGGTHCRLALARVDGMRVALDGVRRYHNAEHPGIEAILADYLAGTACEAACLAVAGPTDGRRVEFTNLDWRIDADQLERAPGLPRVELVNDFVAVGWGLNALQADETASLQAGSSGASGVRIAMGAGTGLGVSICVPRSGAHHPIPTEGGHIAFAPMDEEQDRLLEFMRGLYGRVSVERLLSGPGIVDLYRFCIAESEKAEAADALLAAPHPAEAISSAGLHADDADAARCLRLFCRLYGQVAGDIALLAGARGGVYLAGGIAPKLLRALAAPDFLAGFHAKGRFSDWIRDIPVHVVLDPDIGLKGAAVAAIHASHGRVA
ncbi:MAG: glucokinase [Pseudomonadota bacterium]